MKRLLKKLSAGLVVAALTVGMAFSSFANVNAGSLGTLISNIEEYKDSSSHSELYKGTKEVWDEIAELRNSDNYKLTDEQASGGTNISFDGKSIYFANTSSDPAYADKLYSYAVNQMQAQYDKFGNVNNNTGTVDGTNNVINDTIGLVNTQADTKSAMLSLSDLMPLVNQITGMIVVVTLLGMAIFTAFDVAYLVFPVAKSAMDNAGSSGNRSVSKTDGKTGEAKFRWVTDDAINAYNQSAETGKNPLMCYLTKRIWSYVAVAIVIYMLMSGNLGVIITFVLDMLGSVFEVLGSLTQAN